MGTIGNATRLIIIIIATAITIKGHITGIHARELRAISRYPPPRRLRQPQKVKGAEGTYCRELADRFGWSRPTAAKVIKALLRRGLLNKRRCLQLGTGESERRAAEAGGRGPQRTDSGYAGFGAESGLRPLRRQCAPHLKAAAQPPTRS
jgi:hypothetical protein